MSVKPLKLMREMEVVVETWLTEAEMREVLKCFNGLYISYGRRFIDFHRIQTLKQLRKIIIEEITFAKEELAKDKIRTEEFLNAIKRPIEIMLEIEREEQLRYKELIKEAQKHIKANPVNENIIFEIGSLLDYTLEEIKNSLDEAEREKT